MASPISDSIEQAPIRGALVLWEPILKPRYGQAFNDPMLWLKRLNPLHAPGPSMPPTASRWRCCMIHGLQDCSANC